MFSELFKNPIGVKLGSKRFIEIIMHNFLGCKAQEKVLKSFDFRTIYGASVLIGLFKKRCHTNGFSDFRVADFLVFTLQAVPEVPKSKPTS